MSGPDPFDPAHFDTVIDGGNTGDVLSFPNSAQTLLLRGNAGQDLLQGGFGDDAGQGGGGDDTFVAGRGNDLFDGGGGTDTYDASQLIAQVGPLGGAFVFGFGGRITKGAIGSDVIGVFDLATLSVTPVEVIVAPLGVDTNLIDLSAQPGQSPDASARVDLRADTIDVVAETVFGVPPGTVLISVTARNFQNVVGTNFDDAVRGDGEANTLRGVEGDDSLYGFGGDDQLAGGDGFDQMRGGGGNDLIFGEAGDDRLRGNDGEDTLEGGDGNNVVSGNAGADLIVVRTLDAGAPDQFDRILDFELGLDTLVIGGAISDFFFGGGLDFIDLGGELALVDRANLVNDIGPFDTLAVFEGFAVDLASIAGIIASTSFNEALI